MGFYGRFLIVAAALFHKVTHKVTHKVNHKVRGNNTESQGMSRNVSATVKPLFVALYAIYGMLRKEYWRGLRSRVSQVRFLPGVP
jgi:predicted alpha/beta-fold hydrolase